MCVQTGEKQSAGLADPSVIGMTLTDGLLRANVCVTARFQAGGLVKRLVEFPLEHGGSVLVETDETPAGLAMRGLGKDRPTVAERADKTFEEATAAVVPAASSLMARLRAAADPPDEIAIEFGVQLSAQTGAFIAAAAAAANFRVSLTWRRAEAQP
jgi:Trypsin-co-occurring domain 1